MTVTNEKPKLPDEMDEIQLFTIGGNSKPFCADLVVNDKQLTMEIDTGAAISFITEQTFPKLYPELSLQSSHATLKTYTAVRLPVLGENKRPTETPKFGRHYRKWPMPPRTKLDGRISTGLDQSRHYVTSPGKLSSEIT